MSGMKSPTASILAPGTPAPDFVLPSRPGETLSLRSLRGKPIVLIFYPADWSPVCGDQLALYNEIDAEFRRFDAKLLAISVDSVWCHGAYAAARKLAFELLADFEPKGDVARKYGVYRAADGIAERALFVIDTNGVIRWSYLSPIDVNPGAEGILEALESVAGGGSKRAT
jgi:peroxiredoxin